MLVRLYGKNFRSLKQPFELSMVAAELTRKEDSQRGVIEMEITGMEAPLRLLRAIAIFGPNASGKSTILNAARALRWLATDSSTRSKPDGDIPPYEPFLLDDEHATAPIELGCDVVHKKSILRYEVTFKAQSILKEKMSLVDNKRERVLIDRKGSGEVGGLLVSASEANRLYVKEMQPNVTVLSKLAQHGPHRGKESVQPYYRAIRDAIRYADYSTSSEVAMRIGRDGDERFADDQEYRMWIMRHLIQSADVGICNVDTRRETLVVPGHIREQIEKSPGGFKLPDNRVVISFVHAGKAMRPIAFSDESSGTKKLFNIGGDWWKLANEPITLLADELSASLHPTLLRRLIQAVNDPPDDTIRSQLIFATHDTGLLDSQNGEPPALRRDQIYLTKKDAFGASELYSLTDFKDGARPVHNIRKRYLSGLYGAIPSVEKLSL